MSELSRNIGPYEIIREITRGEDGRRIPRGSPGNMDFLVGPGYRLRSCRPDAEHNGHESWCFGVFRA